MPVSIHRMAADVLLISKVGQSLALCLGLYAHCHTSHSVLTVSVFSKVLQWITSTSVESKCLQSLHVGVIQDTMQVADTISPNVYRRIKSVHNDSAESKLHIIAMLTDTCHTISHSSSSKKRSRRRRPSGQVVREVRRLPAHLEVSVSACQVSLLV